MSNVTVLPDFFKVQEHSGVYENPGNPAAHPAAPFKTTWVLEPGEVHLFVITILAHSHICSYFEQQNQDVSFNILRSDANATEPPDESNGSSVAHGNSATGLQGYCFPWGQGSEEATYTYLIDIIGGSEVAQPYTFWVQNFPDDATAVQIRLDDIQRRQAIVTRKAEE